MSLPLRNKNILLPLLMYQSLLILFISVVIYAFDLTWNTLDYLLLDVQYKRVVENGKGPEVSPRVQYINISDDTYKDIASNTLKRDYLAKLNNTLAYLTPNGVLYDIIFARRSLPHEDSLFAASIKDLGVVYMPVGFSLHTEPVTFNWREGEFYDYLSKAYVDQSIQTVGEGTPFRVQRALEQIDQVIEASAGIGHISAQADPDGVYRHYPLVVKVDSFYFPTVTLQMFLDDVMVPFDSLTIAWDDHITIPALERSFLEAPVTIPVNEHGEAFIPFPEFWNSKGRQSMEAQSLISRAKETKNLDELTTMYEGNFVFIGDVSTGIADVGHTPLENDVPLVAIHGALFNAMLTNTFYSEHDAGYAVVLILIAGFLLLLSALPKSNVPLFVTGTLLIILFFFYGYYEMLQFRLLPTATTTGAILILLLALMTILQIVNAKHEAFVKNAFSKYVPSSVVDELIDQPGKLQLEGEDRELTILFSDVASFTAISEKMAPHDLVKLLNRYLTEMTSLIVDHGGIIDKFIGDGILAEFGAPLPLDKHADQAVKTGLAMQRSIIELNKNWQDDDYPNIGARVGINTGRVIVGNMGSDQVFDYTVIGDPVNLAARLESANKQYGTYLMISEFTFEQITKELFQYRPLDVIKVKGKTRAVKVYEVYALAGEPVSEQDAAYYQHYEQAFTAYLNKQFDEAADDFRKALQYRDQDLASREFLRRIEMLKTVELEDDWDGSTALLIK